MAMTEKTRPVFDYLMANQGVDLTAQDISDALDTPKRSIDGVVTGMQKKGLTIRTEREIEVTDDEGKTSHKKVKFITLTDAGLAFDPDAE
jgi:hypothetical protein